MAHTDRLLRLLNSVSYRGINCHCCEAPGTAKDDPEELTVQEIIKWRSIVHAGGGPSSFGAFEMRSVKNHGTKRS